MLPLFAEIIPNWPAHPLNVRGGEAVHAEGVGDLAAVMYVVLISVTNACVTAFSAPSTLYRCRPDAART